MTIKFFEATRTVFRKELTDGKRDKRSIGAALFFPIFGPVMILFSYYMIAETIVEPEEMTLPVIGASHAPRLVQWLAQNGVTAEPAPAEPKQAIRDGEIDFTLRIPGDYAEKLENGRPAAIELYLDDSRHGNRGERLKIERMVNGYAQQIGALRLIARGINPQLAVPMVLQPINVASQQEIAARILNSIPLFVILAAFVCGMQIAIDATAGERERGSLESLLINPVPRSAIVLGKWMAAALFSAAGLGITLVGCVLVLDQIPIEQLGLSFELGATEIIGLLAAVLPMSLMAPALQMLLSTFAKSYKEAQAYVSMLVFMPMVPYFYTLFTSTKSAAWTYLIPFLSQQLLISDVLGGETPNPILFVLSAVTLSALALAGVLLTARLFKRESIIFGR